MASSSSLWRTIPLLAGAFAVTGVVAIVLFPEQAAERLLEEMRSPGGEGSSARLVRITGVIDGKDAERPSLRIALEPVAGGFRGVTEIAAVPGHDHYLAVLQKGGTASLLAPDAGSSRPFFTVDVETRSEMGLLGIAFPPDFDTSGVFYVHHNPAGARKSQIHRWSVDPKTLKDPTQQALVLEVEQPYANHDGGQLLFGPDGYLYAALGDGGAGFDPKGNGQDGQTLLGSILRIAPRPDGEGYTVPSDNPFVGDDTVKDEIFAYGLRNPWKMTFTADGRLVAADVGQNEWEEVDLVPAGGNLGWARQEAFSCLEAPCEGFVDPIWAYGHDEGASITGGVMARSTGIEGLDGRYLCGDFQSGRLWALALPDTPGTRAAEPAALGKFRIMPSTFGTDAAGRIYVGDYQGGSIYRIVDVASPGSSDRVR